MTDAPPVHQTLSLAAEFPVRATQHGAISAYLFIDLVLHLCQCSLDIFFKALADFEGGNMPVTADLASCAGYAALPTPRNRTWVSLTLNLDTLDEEPLSVWLFVSAWAGWFFVSLEPGDTRVKPDLDKFLSVSLPALPGQVMTVSLGLLHCYIVPKNYI